MSSGVIIDRDQLRRESARLIRDASALRVPGAPARKPFAVNLNEKQRKNSFKTAFQKAGIQASKPSLPITKHNSAIKSEFDDDVATKLLTLTTTATTCSRKELKRLATQKLCEQRKIMFAKDDVYRKLDEEDFEDSMQTESAEEDEDADIESDTENESKSNQDESKVNDEDETSEQNVDETAPKATSNGKHREQDDSLKDNHTLKNADATHTHTSKKHAHISKESITHNQQFTSRDQNASNDCDWAEIDPEMLSLCSGVFESQPQTAHSSKCLSKENPNQLTFSGTPIEEGKSQSEHPTSTLSGSSYTDFRFSPQPDDDPEEYDKNVFCEVFESHNTRTPSVDYKKTNNVPHATDDPMSHTTGDIFAQYDIQNGDEDSEEGDEDSEKGDEDSEEGDEDTDDFRNAAGSTSKSFIDDAALETDDDECDDYDNDDHKDIGLYKQPRKTAFQRKRHASQLQPTKNSISDIYCKVNTQSPGSISSKKNCQAHARTEANAMTKTSKDMYFGNGTTAASSIESFTNTQGDSDTDSNGEDLGGEEEDEADRLLTDDSDDDEDDGDNFNNDNDDQDNDNNRSTAVEFQNEDSLFKRVFPTASSSSGSSSRRHFSTFAADSVDGRLPSEDENEEYDEEEEERLFRRAEFASHISLIRNENSQNSVFEETFYDSSSSQFSITRSRSGSISSRFPLMRSDSLLRRSEEDLSIIRSSKCVRAKATTSSSKLFTFAVGSNARRKQTNPQRHIKQPRMKRSKSTF